MDRPTCETCPYWAPHTKNPPSGSCRIRHPTHDTLECDDGAVIPWGWPESLSFMWCGEHPDFTAWITSQRKPPLPIDGAPVYWDRDRNEYVTSDGVAIKAARQS